MKLAMASLRDAKDYFTELPAHLDGHLDDTNRQTFSELLVIVDQFFNTAASINMQAVDDYIITSAEATEVGEHGFILLLQLIDLMDKLELPHKRREIEQVSLIFARWIIRFEGRIRHLEPIVNACAQLANILQDRNTLKALYNLMSQVADSCTSEIQQDLELGDQLRPWRLLHINRSIVATRTHDPEIIINAFDALLAYLPFEANNFFAEGMKEMDALYYPTHVRDLMELYYSQKPSVKIH
ncbi:MAG: hypothetical protein GY820_27445 [Gammaproteobacteria bacterium]|nr:hypothetical protein [Gammaproteobacteria bacterium]